MMVETARSSCAAETNHASYADGRQVDALVEHRVEERGVGGRVLLARLGEVAHRALAEEHREHGARGLHRVRHRGRLERLGHGVADGVRGGVEVRVDLGRREPERGQPGGRGDGVPGQGAGLVDRPLRRQVRHEVGAPAEGRGGEAAAHHLAEGHQVGGPALDRPVEAPAALRGGAEPGHHLVADEQRTVGAAGLGEERVEAGRGRDDAHVAGRRLGDEAGDPRPVGREGGLRRPRGRCRAGPGSRPPRTRVRRLVPGTASVATPEPASASSASTWPW